MILGRARSLASAVFAGDRRVWLLAAALGVPLAIAVVVYCAVPRTYLTGTDSAEVLTFIAEAHPREQLCIPDLRLPANTGRVQLQLITATTHRPKLEMALRAGGRAIHSTLAPRTVGASRISNADFPIPTTPATPESRSASVCVKATATVNWGGTPFAYVPPNPAKFGGHDVLGRIAVWYLPPRGVRSSYFARAGAILKRAALFRPGFAGPAFYVFMLLVLLPALAIAAIRCVALAVAGASGMRRLGTWLFAIAALNFACWALITPPFQAPDEVDHYAYTQSLVERGKAPSPNPASTLPRWSQAEALSLEDMAFPSDHQAGDSRVPWLRAEEREYEAHVAALHPSESDTGGNETAASHGPIYYYALAPGYLLGGSSPLDQLTFMRLMSALIGALTVLFTFLLARELAPRRPWLAVLAALFVAYQPMYGFISGAVNNDVGVNAGAAALEFLTVWVMRRGIGWRSGLAIGALLGLLPFVKATALPIYPVVALGLLFALWRHHPGVRTRGRAVGERLRAFGGSMREARRGLLITLVGAVGGVAVYELVDRLSASLHPAEAASGAAGVGAASATSLALEHPLDFLAYLWELFLPRLSFMTPHFETTLPAGYEIFVERGWAAFGWYDVFFPRWIYQLLAVMMLLTILLALLGIWRERPFLRRHLPEAIVIVLIPIAVVVGFEAAYYTTGARPAVAEFGRYAFPAIAAFAVLVIGALHALGRRRVLAVGIWLIVAMAIFSYVSQLKTLTGFYA